MDRFSVLFSMNRLLLSVMLALWTAAPLFAQYHAVLYNGTGSSAQDRLTAMAVAGIVNRDSARLYLLNVYEPWSYSQTDETWWDIYRSRGKVVFDSIAGIGNLIERFRPFIAGAVTYDPAATYGNFPGQNFLWQGEYAALIGGLTSRVPLTAAAAVTHNLASADSLFVTDPFDGDSARWLPARMESPSHPWNTAGLSAEQRYLTMLNWGTECVLPLCNPSKMYIREITDFTLRHRMFQVNLAGNDDLKLDSMPAPKADILEKCLTFLRQRNGASVFHLYGWIRPEPMTQWFAWFGASFHETLLGNLSWHSSFPAAPRSFVPASAVDPDTVTVGEKYYIVFIGSEGDASNWQFSFQSGAWLSPKRGAVPFTWGWNLHLFEECPFVAGYYYDTATPNDGFISVTSPLGYAYPDLWPIDVRSGAVAPSRSLLERYGLRTVYGYKHYEGKGTATYRGKAISNSFDFLKYGQFQQAVGAGTTFLYDPQLALQTPLTMFGGLLFNHCDDGSFYGNVANISTAASRILAELKKKPAPRFLLAGYQRMRQDDFGVRPDPSSSDLSMTRLEQVLSLMRNDTAIGSRIQAVTAEHFSALLRRHHGIAGTGRKGPVPASLSLSQNHPNPFNPATVIRFSLSAGGPVVLDVYDLLGRRAASLAEGEWFPPGEHALRFEPERRGLSGGVYLYRLTAGGESVTRRMLYLR